MAGQPALLTTSRPCKADLYSSSPLTNANALLAPVPLPSQVSRAKELHKARIHSTMVQRSVVRGHACQRTLHRSLVLECE
jgi:hypothetical protein